MQYIIYQKLITKSVMYLLFCRVICFKQSIDDNQMKVLEKQKKKRIEHQISMHDLPHLCTLSINI
ncbi:hypothetical protein T11_3748 [Trichinella zimbabwensis]|uniref:Uncharacterized protein n=1 Tax=Trichinella zimbabwensis TaxID=268475 RepID=A0A0V1I321_9BILA|nr:hypothetical protein T11_3748 [Trichinella zimbabwensis]